MTHRHDRTLATSGLARVEGEGAMHVRVRGSQRQAAMPSSSV
jgi:sulfhydrogenase subunit alpha